MMANERDTLVTGRDRFGVSLAWRHVARSGQVVQRRHLSAIPSM